MKKPKTFFLKLIHAQFKHSWLKSIPDGVPGVSLHCVIPPSNAFIAHLYIKIITSKHCQCPSHKFFPTCIPTALCCTVGMR